MKEILFHFGSLNCVVVLACVSRKCSVGFVNVCTNTNLHCVMTDFHFPPAFEQRMRAQLGKQWQDFAAAHQQTSPVSIRINAKKTGELPPSSPVPWTTGGFYLDQRPSFTLDPAFHAGSYYVQEASSMFLEQAFLQCIEPGRSLNVLDLCAAPGGKSTHLLSMMNKESLLVSNEIIRSRASVLLENVQKWGYNNVVVTCNDPEDFQRLPGFFDVIVADAPCSGEGLFRKDPQAMQEWSPDNVAICARRQQRVLRDSWPCLKEGGILIYSTCTYSESENEANLKWLKDEYDVAFLPLILDEAWGVEKISSSDTMGYRLFPHRVKGEGFFLSVMRKRSGEGDTRMKNKNIFTQPPRKIIEQLQPWIQLADEKVFIVRNDKIQFIPANKLPEIAHLSRNLHLLMAGTLMAILKHDKLVPEHPAAMSVDLDTNFFNCIDLDLPDALRFLRKETLPLQASTKGFALIRYKSHILGWVNILDNRMNNLYPSDWRIRMTEKSHS